MINTNKQSSKKKTLIIIAIIVAAVVVASGLYITYATDLFRDTPNSQSNINEDKPTDEQLNAGNDVKDNTVNDSKDGSSDTPAAPIPQENGTSKVLVNITSSNVNNGVLQIRAMIEAVISNGTCTLTLTKDGRTITKTSSTQALPSTSTCQGFDIPTSELGTGEWQVNLVFKAGNYEGNITSTVTI